MRAIVVNGLKSNIVFVNGGTTGNNWWPIMREGVLVIGVIETGIDAITVVTESANLF